MLTMVNIIKKNILCGTGFSRCVSFFALIIAAGF